jgi:hypothetical protein
MPFEGKVDVTYTKNDQAVVDILEDDIIDDIIDAVKNHVREHLRVQHPEINTEDLAYEASDPDYLAEMISANIPQEEIQIPQLSIPIGDDRYVATFGLLEFTNQNGGRRRHKSRSRRAKKTAKRRLQRKHNLKRKTHRSKRKLHRK